MAALLLQRCVSVCSPWRTHLLYILMQRNSDERKKQRAKNTKIELECVDELRTIRDSRLLYLIGCCFPNSSYNVVLVLQKPQVILNSIYIRNFSYIFRIPLTGQYRLNSNLGDRYNSNGTKFLLIF